MKGRTRKPTAVLKLQGTFRPKRHAGTLELPPCAPARPADLSAEAAAEFDRLAAALGEVPGLLVAVDGDALAAYAKALTDERLLRGLIARDGVLVDGKDGKRIHPAMTTLHKVNEEIAKYQQQFGLTPAARSRVKVDAKPQKNAKDAYFG